jgi:hypothetical protein
MNHSNIPLAFTFRKGEKGEQVTIEEALKSKEDWKPFYCYGCLQLDHHSRVELTPVAKSQPYFRRSHAEQQHLIGCPYADPLWHLKKLAQYVQLPLRQEAISLVCLSPAISGFHQMNHKERMGSYLYEEVRQLMAWIQEMSTYFPQLTPLKTLPLKAKLAEKTIPLSQLFFQGSLEVEGDAPLLLLTGRVEKIEELESGWQISLSPDANTEFRVQLTASAFLHPAETIQAFQGKRIAVLGYTRVQDSQLSIELFSLTHQVALLGPDVANLSLQPQWQKLDKYFYLHFQAKGKELYSLQVTPQSFYQPYFEQRIDEEREAYERQKQGWVVQKERLQKEYKEKELLIQDKLEQQELLEKRIEAIKVAIKETPFWHMILGKNRRRKAERDQLEHEFHKLQDEVALEKLACEKINRTLEQGDRHIQEMDKEWQLFEQGAETERSRKEALQEKIIWEIASEVQDEAMLVGVDWEYHLPEIRVTLYLQYCRKADSYYIPLLREVEPLTCHNGEVQRIEDLISACWQRITAQIAQMKQEETAS